ncbi:hypothetical protein [Streptomyces sp. NPDC058579]|uniref:hypothetical protein n=1 Tax=Streptomyces sp. NPDC058579 TaxID=3346548 RepID=UPI00365C7F27
MWDSFLLIMICAIVADSLLHRIRRLWRRMRRSQTVAALNRGETVHIRCAARFRNTGGRRHRATLTVKAEGAFLTTLDGTVSDLQLGVPATSVEIVAERSMMVCEVAGRQLEVLLPDEENEENHLLKAVEISLLYREITTPGTSAA